ncbi:hypothetical protein WDV93_16725 [Pantoea ananatis]
MSFWVAMISHNAFISTRAICSIIAESGFGTGLNFLTLWQAFDSFQQHYPDAPLKRLHFISFEKFPLTQADLTAAHQHWPGTGPLG